MASCHPLPPLIRPASFPYLWIGPPHVPRMSTAPQQNRNDTSLNGPRPTIPLQRDPGGKPNQHSFKHSQEVSNEEIATARDVWQSH
jgi:hypothetical protein